MKLKTTPKVKGLEYDHFLVRLEDFYDSVVVPIKDDDGEYVCSHIGTPCYVPAWQRDIKGRDALKWTKEQFEKYDEDIANGKSPLWTSTIVIAYVKSTKTFIIIDGFGRACIKGNPRTWNWLTTEGQKYLKNMHALVVVHYLENEEKAVEKMVDINCGGLHYTASDARHAILSVKEAYRNKITKMEGNHDTSKLCGAIVGTNKKDGTLRSGTVDSKTVKVMESFNNVMARAISAIEPMTGVPSLTSKALDGKRLDSAFLCMWTWADANKELSEQVFNLMAGLAWDILDNALPLCMGYEGMQKLQGLMSVRSSENKQILKKHWKYSFTGNAVAAMLKEFGGEISSLKGLESAAKKSHQFIKNLTMDGSWVKIYAAQATVTAEMAAELTDNAFLDSQSQQCAVQNEMREKYFARIIQELRK